MKKYIAIVLCLVLGIENILNLSVMSWYMLNKQFIVENLCVERDVQDSQCQGNCVLEKTLHPVSQNKQEEQGLPVLQLESLIYLAPDIQNITKAHLRLSKVYSLRKSFYSKLFKEEIFHPPIS